MWPGALRTGQPEAGMLLPGCDGRKLAFDEPDVQVTAHSCVQGAVQCLLVWILSHVGLGAGWGAGAEKDGEALRSQYRGVAAS